MKVTTVSANIRYSRDMGQGAWKVVELGAEATLDAKDDWQTAQAGLYQQLGQQLRALWANGHGKAQETPAEAAETPAQPEPPAHFCQAHQTDFKRFEKDGRVWYSGAYFTPPFQVR
ncbi:MAG: hypothetical protein FJ316_02180 [SAR202 cluster bacterium]|nr:hypothetical protein [SAR202 cluster bacterium]